MQVLGLILKELVLKLFYFAYLEINIFHLMFAKLSVIN